MSRTPHHIAIFNVKFSPNLGDGLLASCLEVALRNETGNPNVFSYDLSGRKDWVSNQGGSLRPLILKTLFMMPTAIKTRLIYLLQKHVLRHKFEHLYAEGLQNAKALVIGGGNLFTDMDLNFPGKLNVVLTLAAKKDIPVYIYGVGVGRKFSKPGLRLLKEGLQSARVEAVFVRDVASKESWDHNFSGPGIGKAIVARDPGLLAAAVFPTQRAANTVPVIMIGIIAAVAINYHSKVRISAAALIAFFRDLGLSLTQQGYQVGYFTNGSPEDRAFMKRMRAEPDLQAFTFKDCDSVQELCDTVSSADCVVAHRMHALIAAYAFGAQTIALQWDEKVKSFMESVDQGGHLYAPETGSVAECAELIIAAMNTKPGVTTHAGVIHEAHDGITQLATLITAAE